MHAAFGGMNIICERHDNFGVCVGILERKLCHSIALFARHIYNILVDGSFVSVEERNELLDAALVAHRFGALFFGKLL